MPLNQLKLVDEAGFHNVTDWPRELITGTGADPRPRLRVDVSQTSFWEGREFRSYYEFSVPDASSVWLRFTTTGDVVLHGRDITVLEGRLRFAQYTGCTPSGVWTPGTIRAVNSMSGTPVFISGTTTEVGGTATGGTERDVTILGTGTSNQAVSATVAITEQGLPVNVYYIELRNTGSGTCTGLYKVHWEERQAASPLILGTV